MFLTDNQFNNIRGIFLNGQSGLEAKAGGLIYSSDTSKNKFVLISNGQIRLIDEGSNYGSKTLAKVKAPFLIGISQILDINQDEIIRSSSNCTFYNLSISGISNDDYFKLSSILLSKLNSFEYIAIHESIKKNIGSTYLDELDYKKLSSKINLLSSIKEIDPLKFARDLKENAKNAIFNLVPTPSVLDTKIGVS